MGSLVGFNSVRVWGDLVPGLGGGFGGLCPRLEGLYWF